MDAQPTLTRVVVAYDGSAPARTALEQAIDLADARQVPLRIVCAVDAFDAIADAAMSQAAREAVASAEQAALSRLPAAAVSAVVTTGAPAARLLDEVVDGDLVVVGTHGHRPVARVFLGSVSTALVTHAAVPVLVARRGAVDPAAPVVVGVDGSAASTAAVALAAQEADRRGAQLRAVMAVDPVVDANGMVSGPDAAAVQESHALLGEAVAGLHERYPDLHVTTEVLTTHPLEALLRTSQDASLLVVGSRGRGALRRALLGSVSREVAQRAAVPVLVVHPAGADGGTVPPDLRGMPAWSR
jgi:nucleotide-binding universal stress UspA family protein